MIRCVCVGGGGREYSVDWPFKKEMSTHVFPGPSVRKFSKPKTKQKLVHHYYSQHVWEYTAVLLQQYYEAIAYVKISNTYK